MLTDEQRAEVIKDIRDYAYRGSEIEDVREGVIISRLQEIIMAYHLMFFQIEGYEELDGLLDEAIKTFCE